MILQWACRRTPKGFWTTPWKNTERTSARERLCAWASEQIKGPSHELRILALDIALVPVVILRDVSLKSRSRVFLVRSTVALHAKLFEANKAKERVVLQPLLTQSMLWIHLTLLLESILMSCCYLNQTGEQGLEIAGKWIGLLVQLILLSLTRLQLLVPRAEIDGDIGDSHKLVRVRTLLVNA